MTYKQKEETNHIHPRGIPHFVGARARVVSGIEDRETAQDIREAKQCQSATEYLNSFAEVSK